MRTFYKERERPYRKKGTGTVKWSSSGWVAYAPEVQGAGKLIVARGLTFKHQAEKALDEWLKANGGPTK